MSIKHDKARAAVLGLALGDAYGRRLEFLRGEQVRTTPAGPGHDFMWTDDTHMSGYVADAVLEHGPGPVDEDRLGFCVGESFSRWLDDPLTPSTAPGNTCMAGARAWRQSQDWTTSGVRHSDGCGAVMRIAPVAIFFEGDDLLRAARVQAVVTHAHPNAPEAAIAAGWILRQLLEGRALDAQLVTEAADHFSRGTWDRSGGSTERALRAAASCSTMDRPWLSIDEVPDGDGGWRSPSALGLSLLAALRWGRDKDGQITAETFQLAIDRAARMDGDSDSVACLAGMFLGAAGGSAAIPGDWLDALPRLDWLDDITRRLLRTAPRPSQRMQARVLRSDEVVIVAVADLHGHPGHLRTLVEEMDAEHGDQWVLVTLGDYVDNGPDIPGLMDDLIALRAARPDRFVPILGNHDLACLRALGWPGNTPDPVWYQRWAGRYWNPDGSTAAAYGARSAEGLARRMPTAHQAFLRSLPWFYDNGEHLFVHAGMAPGPLAPQRRRLAHKVLPDVHTFLPPQIREKDLAGVMDADWDRVVVSGHTKQPAQRAGVRGQGPHIIADRRICLSGEVDQTGILYAIELPARRVLAVDPAGRVHRQS